MFFNETRDKNTNPIFRIFSELNSIFQSESFDINFFS